MCNFFDILFRFNISFFVCMLTSFTSIGRFCLLILPIRWISSMLPVPIFMLVAFRRLIILSSKFSCSSSAMPCINRCFFLISFSVCLIFSSIVFIFSFRFLFSSSIPASLPSSADFIFSVTFAVITSVCFSFSSLSIFLSNFDSCSSFIF
ncbi:unnamed protein product [Plutella xylostella]|uniref:(diamondback moth) hypothetical protein n=1 Tax=Plutella xylostella TaxID=51655 RepID=A0A8S4G4Z5_PLUXY|nr:unnamed protein product [Plutella xylostella]